MDTLHLPEAGRRRRRYSAEFKSDIVAACLQPGVSTTAIALANKINPNLVRRWIRLHQAQVAEGVEVATPESEPDVGQVAHASPVLIPVTVSEPTTLAIAKHPHEIRLPQRVGSKAPSPRVVSSPPPDEAIRLEFRRGDTLLNVSWPAMQAESCAQWLRKLLR